jgi:hypothetical protein
VASSFSHVAYDVCPIRTISYRAEKYAVFGGFLTGESNMNMRLYKGMITTILTGLLCVGLSACEKEGPAENAGKAIDDTASNVTKEASEAKESVDKKMDQ